MSPVATTKNAMSLPCSPRIHLVSTASINGEDPDIPRCFNIIHWSLNYDILYNYSQVQQNMKPPKKINPRISKGPWYYWKLSPMRIIPADSPEASKANLGDSNMVVIYGRSVMLKWSTHDRVHIGMATNFPNGSVWMVVLFMHSSSKMLPSSACMRRTPVFGASCHCLRLPAFKKVPHVAVNLFQKTGVHWSPNERHWIKHSVSFTPEVWFSMVSLGNKIFWCILMYFDVFWVLGGHNFRSAAWFMSLCHTRMTRLWWSALPIWPGWPVPRTAWNQLRSAKITSQNVPRKCWSLKRPKNQHGKIITPKVFQEI